MIAPIHAAWHLVAPGSKMECLSARHLAHIHLMTWFYKLWWTENKVLLTQLFGNSASTQVSASTAKHFKPKNIQFISSFWILPKVFQRLLLRCSQATSLAAGKSVIDDLVDDRIVHRRRFGKKGRHHGELYGNGVWPSKSWPHGDHCIGNPGNQEACTDQHRHLTQGK